MESLQTKKTLGVAYHTEGKKKERTEKKENKQGDKQTKTRINIFLVTWMNMRNIRLHESKVPPEQNTTLRH